MRLSLFVISCFLLTSFTALSQELPAHTSITVDPETGWQIYADTTTGFSIHFPAKWESTPAQRGFFCGTKPGLRKAKWSVISVPVDDEEGKKIFFGEDSLKISGMKSSEKTITINGIEGRYLLETHEKWADMHSESIYIKTDTFWYFISNDGEKEEGFDQFYRSFRLIR